MSKPHPDFPPKLMSECEAFDGDEEVDEGAEEANATGAGKSNKIYTKQLRGGGHPIDFNVSSDINKKILKKETWLKNDRKPRMTEVSKEPSVQLGSANISGMEFIGMIDTFDRPGNAYAEDTYARCGTYADSHENKPGKRLPKAGAFAEAGVGRARAEFSVFEAEAKGPNASAGVGASVGALGASAMARAEIASASARAGPVGVKLGLGVDTGVSIGADGLEAKVLGTGVSIGPKTSVSVLGSEVSCSVM